MCLNFDPVQTTVLAGGGSPFDHVTWRSVTVVTPCAMDTRLLTRITPLTLHSNHFKMLAHKKVWAEHYTKTVMSASLSTRNIFIYHQENYIEFQGCKIGKILPGSVSLSLNGCAIGCFRWSVFLPRSQCDSLWLNMGFFMLGVHPCCRMTLFAQSSEGYYFNHLTFWLQHGETARHI